MLVTVVVVLAVVSSSQATELDDTTRNPQFVCQDGFYRNHDDVCVPDEECSAVVEECRPTCANPNPENCTAQEPPSENEDGCQCQEGYILSETNGKCVKIEDCPKSLGCNGDPHAVVAKCPLPCPSTCDAPEAPRCKKMCTPVGCECESGYILTEVGGKCIRPEECSGGDPCGMNGTFVQCKSDCPNDFCPEDDTMGIIECESNNPNTQCYSGCICKLNNKRLSSEDPRCITSTDCPPVNCTRPHEIWNSCPMECSSEFCDAVDEPKVVCDTFVLNCQPKCVCEDNYYRNGTAICVSAQECREINAQKNKD